MKKYIVSIPVAGAFHVEVEASSSDEAKEKAWEKVNADGTEAGYLEWEFYDTLAEGNVLYAPLRETDTYCCEDLDSEG